MTITIQKASTTASKAIALIFVSIGLAFALKRIDSDELSEMNSLSPDAYVQIQRMEHQHSFLHHFIIMFIFALLYFLAVEGVAWIVRGIWPKKPNISK